MAFGQQTSLDINFVEIKNSQSYIILPHTISQYLVEERCRIWDMWPDFSIKKCNFTTIWKMLSSIQLRDLNSQPLVYESPPLLYRPGLPSCCPNCYSIGSLSLPVIFRTKFEEMHFTLNIEIHLAVKNGFNSYGTWIDRKVGLTERQINQKNLLFMRPPHLPPL